MRLTQLHATAPITAITRTAAMLAACLFGLANATDAGAGEEFFVPLARPLPVGDVTFSRRLSPTEARRHLYTALSPSGGQLSASAPTCYAVLARGAEAFMPRDADKFDEIEAHDLERACRVLEAVSHAKAPVRSYLTPAFGDASSFSWALAGAFPADRGSNERLTLYPHPMQLAPEVPFAAAAASVDRRYSMHATIEPDGSLFLHADERDRESYGMHRAISELARADFDGDGTEDLLTEVRTADDTACFGMCALAWLTRKSPTAPLVLLHTTAHVRCQ